MSSRLLRSLRPLSIAVALLLLGAACSSDGGGAGVVETVESVATTAATIAPTEAPAPADSDSSDDPAPQEELTKVRFQLDWSPNTNHTGIFVADEMGWFADEGIELEILPYSGGN